MSVTLDARYRSQRSRIAAAVTHRATVAFSALYTSEEQAIAQIVPIVEGGQKITSSLVSAYMAAKMLQATRVRATIALNPSDYINLRAGTTPADVYQRPFAVFGSTLAQTNDQAAALAAAQAQLSKLAATDIQLAQTNAARDWMTQEPRIVGYRRVLSGAGPHCALCTAASTRTYRSADLMAIHEHCSCGVEPLWGTENVPSVGTTVRVDEDPEIGPRLMAATWSPVGPRLAEPEPTIDLGTLSVPL